MCILHISYYAAIMLKAFNNPHYGQNYAGIIGRFLPLGTSTIKYYIIVPTTFCKPLYRKLESHLNAGMLLTSIP